MSGSFSGSLEGDPGTTIEFGPLNDARTLDGESSITSAGTVRFTGGTTNFEGIYAVEATVLEGAPSSVARFDMPLAETMTLDQTGGDLRSALLALLENESDVLDQIPGPDADLGAALEACPAAMALLRKVVLLWLDGI